MEEEIKASKEMKKTFEISRSQLEAAHLRVKHLKAKKSSQKKIDEAESEKAKIREVSTQQKNQCIGLLEHTNLAAECHILQEVLQNIFFHIR